MAKPNDMLAECGKDIKIVKVHGGRIACTHCLGHIYPGLYVLAFGTNHETQYTSRHDNVYMHVQCFDDFIKKVNSSLKSCNDPIEAIELRSRMRDLLKQIDINTIPKVIPQLKKIHEDFKKLKVPYPAADCLCEFGNENSNEVCKTYYGDTCPVCGGYIRRQTYAMFLHGRVLQRHKPKKQSCVVIHPNCIKELDKAVSEVISVNQDTFKKNVLQCAAEAL